ncbi:helix-turn-helix domain-containing protein [Microbacterium sp.]|uniref:winged helix-turn-helix transcriptional regulator n=1 Tax=Microbacterium sp. TaxID=51671 RepID=UPI0025D9EE2B|nr:helix-turn-helix domain-containing protein [Microbacterium sp.]
MNVSFAEIQGSSSGCFAKGSPTRLVLDHVSSTWGVLVLGTLSEGTRRWGELRRDLDGISEKMLASTLRALATDGLVHREPLASVPPHVEYSLTPRGRELAERMMPFLEWIATNSDDEPL